MNTPHRKQPGLVECGNRKGRYRIMDVTQAVNGYISLQPFPNHRMRRQGYWTDTRVPMWVPGTKRARERRKGPRGIVGARKHATGGNDLLQDRGAFEVR